MLKEISFVIPNMCKTTLLINVDTEKEKVRIDKELKKLLIEQEKYNKKLSNPQFIDKAPKEEVCKVMQKLKDIKSKIIAIEENK